MDVHLRVLEEFPKAIQGKSYAIFVIEATDVLFCKCMSFVRFQKLFVFKKLFSTQKAKSSALLLILFKKQKLAY